MRRNARSALALYVVTFPHARVPRYAGCPFQAFPGSRTPLRRRGERSVGPRGACIYMPPAKSPPTKKALPKVATTKSGDTSNRGAPQSSQRGAPQDSKRGAKPSADAKASASKKPAAAAAASAPPPAKAAAGDKKGAAAPPPPPPAKVVTSSGMNKKIDYLTDEIMARKPLDDKARDALIKKCGPLAQE